MYSRNMDSNVDLIGTFTVPEMEYAVQLPPRSVELLKREQLMLGQVTPAGRGRQARYDFRVVPRLAMLAALTPLTSGFVAAARLGNALAEEMEWRYGSVPFGVFELQGKVAAKLGGETRIRAPSGDICLFRAFQEAWKHSLTDDAGPVRGDFTIVLWDGGNLGEQTLGGPKYLTGDGGASSVAPFLVYRQGRRKDDLAIDLIEDTAAEAEALRQLAGAVTVTTINVALAVRRAIVRIIKLREGYHTSPTCGDGEGENAQG